MVGEDRWQEIRRLHRDEQVPIAEIARRLDLDRKTVRRCLRQEAWQPYERPVRTDTLLVEHAEYLRERAPKVGYSAQVLWQELRERRFAGSYQTVKRFVRPLRTVEALAERATVRFETAPGHQSQIDWGAARVHFRHQPVVLHFFVLTLGYSRRHYMEPALNERESSGFKPRLLKISVSPSSKSATAGSRKGPRSNRCGPCFAVQFYSSQCDILT